MDFSSSNIRNRSFSKGLRGFKQNEVHSFLDHVADKWDELEEQVETLEANLDDVNGKLKRVETEKKNAEERLQELEDKEERLNEKERKLEQKEARLRSIAQRLRTTLEEEQQELAHFDAPDQEVPNTAAARDPQPAPDRTNGEPSSDSPSHEEASEEPSPESTSEAGSKTSEEWVDSLFPNRLPDSKESQATGEPGVSETEGKQSEGESQFEAIKEDVQGMKAKDEENDSSEDEKDAAPPTDEMEQIWDVFDDPKM